jgi:ATP-dependent Clp protease ATP-binding subunit ClpA
MFDWYTDRARRAVVLAGTEAVSLNHDSVGTEHLLLGLLAEEGGVAAQALQACGLTLEAARLQVAQVKYRDQSPAPGLRVFTPQMKKVLEIAVHPALLQGNNYIATERLLLGLIRAGEGVSAEILANLDGGAAAVREKVLEMLRGYAEHEEPRVTVVSEEEPWPIARALSALRELRHRAAQSAKADWADSAEVEKQAAIVGAMDYALGVVKTINSVREPQPPDPAEQARRAVREFSRELASTFENLARGFEAIASGKIPEDER